jgi:hypothetical protein
MRNLALDGVRGVAILAVLFFHHHLLNSGWIGVDLFFVLSGYLITGILRRDREKPHYWECFYVKRATRILPPVLLLLIVWAAHLHVSATSLLWYFLFLGNFANTSSHAIDKLAFVWSLAVEEHFYLFFPFAVRFMQRQALVRLLIATLCVEPLLRYGATSYLTGHLSIYYWTFFRLDGLAMGALLAIVLEDAYGRMAQAVGRSLRGDPNRDLRTACRALSSRLHPGSRFTLVQCGGLHSARDRFHLSGRLYSSSRELGAFPCSFFAGAGVYGHCKLWAIPLPRTTAACADTRDPPGG